ncbi:hypothetical protein [Delftia sp. RIT313]|uniref:hypothetical protein n=1 Tax=Delftia sp. RIT313 TaxID=1468410 RepID=UPI000452A4A6|nr:hypothetical protein [Delftia sp. RIT313]EZP56396.1 hypothetical protein BW39_01709 [Delftia sp. RIT313]
MRGFDPEKMKQVRANALANQPRLGFRPRGSGGQQEESQPGPGLGFGPTSVLEARKAQAQNQAPDSIPGMFKPGEFVLPPDTVHAMGGADALKAVVDATHTPVSTEPVIPRGFKPKVFFDNGKRPEDQIPTDGQRAAPAADGSQDNPMNSELGRNVTNTLGALPGAAGFPGAVSRVAGAGANALSGAGQAAGFAGRAATAAAPLGVPAAGAVGLGAAYEADRPVGGLPSNRANTAAAPAAVPAGTPTTATTSTAGSTMGPPDTAGPSEVMPGVFRRGNSYADSAQAAALGDQPRGLPSWRNQNAANNLAGQQQAESMGRVQAAMAPPPTSPIQRVAIMGSGDARGFRRASNLRASDRGDLARLQEAQRYDTRLGFATGQQQLERDRIAADMFNTARGFNVAQQRLDTERRTADSEIAARGFKSRALQQEERLRNTFLDPNATPQQRQQAQQSLRAINGEADPSQWALQVTPATKNADGSTTESSVYRINKASGDVQRVDAAAGLPPGMTKQVGTSGGKPVYEDANGRRFVGA